MFADLSLVAIQRRDGDAAIGIDVGGTKTALGLVDAAGLGLLARTVIPTGPDRGGAAVLAAVRAAARALAHAAGREGRRVTGVGLVVPEIVSRAGVITSAAVIPEWDELPVALALSEIAPVRVEADVRASAFAEAVLGAGRPYAHHVFVTVGTGISYCAVYQGRPLAGTHGGALNIGTSVLARLPAGSPEPREVVLEEIASGRALASRYAARGGRARGADDVLAAAERGDEVAAGVLSEGAEALGIGIALLVNLLDPEAVIVGGGLGSADTPYWTATRASVRRYLHAHAAGTVLIQGELGADAGVIGAGLVGLQPSADGAGTDGPGRDGPGADGPRAERVERN